MSQFRVTRARPFSAEMRVPGDKSISHRSAILAALANGPCEIEGFLPSEDCLNTVEALRSLGVRIEDLEGSEAGPTRLRVHGCKGQFEAPNGPIDCGNSGTSMRLLAGVLAAQPFESVLTGDASLSRRPMGRIIEPLSQMGAHFEATGEKQCAPLKITGSDRLEGIEYAMPVASAQVKSAILLAGLRADGRSTVVEPGPCRDHTERMLELFLVKVLREGNRVSTWGGQVPESQDFRVPGDVSSAAFWVAAAAAMPEARLRILGVGLNPSRTGFLKTLIRMGARISEVEESTRGEPYGNLEVHGQSLHGTEIGGEEIGNVIDEIPILAVTAALAEGTTVIRDAAELRVKESDRIAVTCEGLRRMGVDVREHDDGMEIRGGGDLRGAEIDSEGDHRIAMAFAIAGLFADGETVIEGVECVNTSYPGFAADLAHLVDGAAGN